MLKMVQIAAWLLLIVLNLNIVNCALENAENSTVAKNDSNKPKADVVKPVEKLSTTARVEKSSAELLANKAKENEEGKKTEIANVDHHNLPEYDQVMKNMDIDIEDSVQTGFYILMALSVSALLFVGFKVYKLRLTRAERKYGVQGDHATQELARLPTSMEEPESEEEDQTIFDINRDSREQIRIF